MNIPESMKDELAAWNNGAGIDLESWVGCSGNFSLAVGYIGIFWPEFVEFEDHVLRGGFSEESLRQFQKSEGYIRKNVEWAMNHLHIADIQYYGCKDITKDKIMLIGNALKEVYEVKLKYQFPKRSFVVEFHIPKYEENLIDYQISFWQEEDEKAS